MADSLAEPTRRGLTMADFLGPARLQPTTTDNNRRNNNEPRCILKSRRSSTASTLPPSYSSSEEVFSSSSSLTTDNSYCPHPVTSSSVDTDATTNGAVYNDNCYPAASSTATPLNSDHTWYSSRRRRATAHKTESASLSWSSSLYSSSSSPLVWISLVLALISCISQVAAIPSHQIHTQMGEKELQQIFQVDSHHQVPEYEVVSIRSRSKRSIDETNKRLVSFNAFGKDVKLSLKRNPHLVKQSLRMWIAEPDSSKGIHYKELTQEAEEDIGEAYQDESNQAALLIHHDKEDGSLLMDGMVGSDLVVKPVPSPLRSQVQKPDDDEAFLDEELQDDWVVKKGFPAMNDSLPISVGSYGRNNTQGMHIIYKAKHINSHSDYALMEPDQDPFKSALRTKRHAESKKREKRDAPYVIYPEILVIVDYDGYRLHGGDNLQVKRYFVSFWNGVDLRYKILRGPKVRISIAGIIISRGRDATPYLERNRVGRDALDSASALTDLGKYLFQERRLPVYDIAVVVTKLDMCRRQFANDICNRGTAGFAYVGGACVVNKRLEKVNSVAIVEDTGGFSGIIVAAHEVGHLLGCVHDGSPAPSYLGGPGAQKCRWEDGYIMSDLRHTERGFQWSACSIAQFHHFLNGDTATCLYNSPHEDSSLPRVLPGKLLSLDAQCRKDRGTSACFKDDRVCAQLFCFDATSGYCVAYRPAAEGSPCGDGHQHCVSGRCVIEHENIIPDYSQITPAVVRGDAYGKSSSFAFPTSSSVLISTTTSPRTGSSSTFKKTTSTTTTTTTRKPPKRQHQQTHNQSTSKKSSSPFTETSPGSGPSNKRPPSNSQSQSPSASTKKSKNNSKNSSRSTTPKPSATPPKSKSTNQPPSSSKKSSKPSSSPSAASTTNNHSKNNNNNNNNSRRSSSQRTSVNFKDKNISPLTQANLQRGRSSDTSSKPSSYSKPINSTSTTTSNSNKQKSNGNGGSTGGGASSSRGGGATGGGDNGFSCQDRVSRIGGSYNCRDFLTRYGYKYCSSPYIQRNCCAAHKLKCIQ